MADKTTTPKVAKSPDETFEGVLRTVRNACRRGGKALEEMGADVDPSFAKALQRIDLAAQRVALDWTAAGLEED